MNNPDPTAHPRLWPLAAIAAGALIALLLIWVPESPQRQMQVMQSILAGTVVLLLGLIWLLAASRLPWPHRWRILGILALAAVLPALALRHGGFTGDLVPVLEWRWSTLPGQLSSPDATSMGDEPVAAYPRFLGPQRNATLSGVRLQTDWQRHPPELVWRQSVGPAWSAFAVQGGMAVTQEQNGELETVVARDLRTGERRWTHRDSARHETSLGGVGPRATPTIDGNQVFAVGGTGLLNALDLATGQLLWQRNIIIENGASVPHWGMSASPLVLGDLVVVAAGGPEGHSLVAYSRETGARAWSSGDARAGYSSPTLARLAGVDQILTFNWGSVTGYRADTGALLWQHPWSEETQPIAQPLPLPGDRLLISSGYGVGSALLQLAHAVDTSPAAVDVRVLWESTRLKAKFTNPVFHEGYVYGLDDGILVCLDPETGERRWKRGRYGHGQLILTAGVLLIQAEAGGLHLVMAHPDGHRELASHPALDDKTWNNPALAAPYLLVRNHREAACFRLAMAPPDEVTMVAEAP